MQFFETLKLANAVKKRRGQTVERNLTGKIKNTWGEKISLQWVKSHVNRHKQWEELTFKQKGNTLADQGAENIYRNYDQLNFPLIRTKLKWIITLEGSPVTGDVVQCLKDFCKMEKAKSFLQKKGAKYGVLCSMM